MSRQWMRLVTVSISGKGGSISVNQDMKIDFEISKGIGSSQNSGTCTIWNLSKQHRGMLGEEFDKIEIHAGYRDAGTSLLAKGDIRDTEHDKETADISSKIEFGDGDKAVNNGGASKTFPKGTKPKEAFEYLAKQLPGAQIGKMEGLDDLPAFTRPVSFFGRAAREMDELGRQFGFYWSIQNGQIEAVKNDKAFQGAIIVSSETGLIGIPSETDKGVKFKCLLNPMLAPNKTVDVRSEWLDEISGRDKRKSDQGGGLYRISSVKHSGTTRGEEFHSEVEANRMAGGKVVK